ncbi:MAG: hypothetical protein LBQ21_01465 [Clostridiales Family XIII bacterium]|jgi:hypothetical protein|nr:hypothetical protein [Clostridiales Family XIII bacterium]
MGMTQDDLHKQDQEKRIQAEPVETHAEQQIEKELFEGGEVRNLTAEEVEERRLKTAETLDQHSAELLRRGLKASLTEISQVAIRPLKTAPALPEGEEYAKLSSRKRRKARSRQTDNVKKATKAGYTENVTGQTLPMRDALIKRQKEERKLEPIKIENWRTVKLDSIFPDDLFTPSFDMKSSTTINIGGIREKLRYADAVLEAIRSDATLSITEQAQADHLEATKQAAEAVLRNTVQANGVNYNMPGSIPSRDMILESRENKIRATAEYQKLVLNRDQLVQEKTFEKAKGTDEYAVAYQEALAIKNGDIEEALGENPQLMEVYRNEIKAAETDHSPKALKLAEVAKETLAERSANREYYKRMKDSGIGFHHAGTAEQYMKMLKLMDEKNDKYVANKEVFDRIFREYAVVEKFVQASQTEMLAIDNLPFPVELRRNFTQIQMTDPRYKAAELRSLQLLQAMKYLLTDEEPSDGAQIVLEKEFGIVTTRRQERKEELWNTPPENPEERTKFVSEHRKRNLKMFENAQRQAVNLGMKDHCDHRIIVAIGTQFEVNADGAPLTQLDAEKMTQNQQVIADITSGDRARQEPLLDDMMQNIRHDVPTPDLFGEDAFLGNLDKLQTITQRSLMISNVKSDFRWYFDDHPELSEEMGPIMDVYAAATTLMMTRMKLYGVNIDGDVWPADSEEEALLIQNGRMLIESAEQDYQTAYTAYLTKVSTR